MTGTPNVVLSVAIVDDDDRYRAYLALMLSRESRMTVHEASNGQELFALLETVPIDCVLLDHSLGLESGLAINEQVRQKYADPPPLVMLTGVGSERTAVKAFHGGMSDYVVKRSLTKEELTCVIRGAIDRKARERTREAETARLQKFSAYDALTGLPTRASMDERLAQLLATAASASAKFAIILIDLNGMKLINEKFGHALGDRVLESSARA